jgi:hypothetical protein
MERTPKLIVARPVTIAEIMIDTKWRKVVAVNGRDAGILWAKTKKSEEVEVEHEKKRREQV